MHSSWEILPQQLLTADLVAHQWISHAFYHFVFVQESEKVKKSISTFTSAVATNWKAANSDLGYLPETTENQSQIVNQTKNGTTDNRCKMKPTHYSPKSSLFTIPINGHRNETILSY